MYHTISLKLGKKVQFWEVIEVKKKNPKTLFIYLFGYNQENTHNHCTIFPKSEQCTKL